MDYFKEWDQAIQRSKRLGLKVPLFEPVNDHRWLGEEKNSQFPYVIQKKFPGITVKHLTGQCLAFNFFLRPVIEEWLGCPVFYTLGWIDDGSERGLFRFDEKFITDALINGHGNDTSMNIHAWLTLPSMEIIDATLPTTFAAVKNQPQMYGGAIIKHVKDVTGLAYKPMLVGEDFFLKACISFQPVVN